MDSEFDEYVAEHNSTACITNEWENATPGSLEGVAVAKGLIFEAPKVNIASQPVEKTVEVKKWDR